MRKLLLLLISLGVILGALGILRKTPSPTPTAVVQEKGNKVTVDLKFTETGATITTSVLAKNAFEALEKAAKINNWKLETKQYDFGVLVESIYGTKNTKDKAWIYFVNSKSAEVAADKINLKEGDKVEWKYIKPQF